MNRTTCDIVIGGGGIAGLSAACVFGTAGFSVICAEPTTPTKDLRTTAILQPAQAILQTNHVWQTLAPHACPLQTMRLIDATNDTINTTADFHANEISPLPFGWNVVNWRLRDALIKRIATLPN
ncbi:MAG: UbiH/UbiF family hydroxylase, partial [Proteobacteria bacterium]|nr:UbiH/UbiF family hydroxylase [Pseudomonadota bacterium]